MKKQVNDLSGIVLKTVINNIPDLWIPDLDIRTKDFDYNYKILVLVNRSGNMYIRHVRVKTTFNYRNYNDVTIRENLLTQLTESFTAIMQPCIVTVLSITPYQQKVST